LAAISTFIIGGLQLAVFYFEANFLYAECSPEYQLSPSRMMARHD